MKGVVMTEEERRKAELNSIMRAVAPKEEVAEEPKKPAKRKTTKKESK